MIKLKLDNRFLNQVKGRVDKYEFEVGVLRDEAHKKAIDGSIKAVAGGPARRAGRPSGTTVAEVSKYIRKQTGINFYTRPFTNPSDRNILKFTNEYLKSLVSSKQMMSSRRRVENLLQAIVRNPITRGDYGGNKIAWATKKGFSRLLVDTGQLFRSITASIRRR